MYTIPSHLDNNKIFIVQRSEIEGRLDAQYYNTRVQIPNAIRLSSFAQVKGGKRIPKGYSYANEQTPYYYLRVADMDNDRELSFDALKYIDQEVFSKLERYEIKEGELAISIAGTIGKVCYLSNVPCGQRVILTENCAKIVVKNKQELNVKYLEVLFKMPFIQKQLEINYIQTTIPKLGIDKIVSLKFPQIPSIDFQQQVISSYNSAYAQKLQKESEAQQLLDSIANDVLTELGISLPHIEKELSKRIFTTSFQQILSNRFDPKGVLLLGDKSGSSIFENVSLKSVAKICKGNSLTSKEADLMGPYPVIAGGQTSPYNHSIANYQGNVITVSASGAYAGYVWYHDYPIYATDCCVIQSKNEQKYLTSYLYEVLHAQQERIYMYQQGAGQPHVYASDLEKLLIPNISIDQQRGIVAHAQELRTKAQTLQAEGKAILENAKKEVEKMIMGE